MIEESLLKSNHIGKDGFIWWIGQVANKSSWGAGASMSVKGKWGARCKVRIVGYHPFSGSILSDDDLPWAQIMIDPAFGSAQGGYGTTLHLTGGETVFGFFLDGDDGQQPVIVGLLYRSEATKNLIEPEQIQKENSSRFKPFTGHKNKVVKPTQRNARVEREIPIGTVPEETIETIAQTETRETYPFTVDQLPSFSGIGTFPFNIDIYNSQNITSGFSNLPTIGLDENASSAVFNGGDIIAGLYCNSPSSAVLQLVKKADITIVSNNGCQNNLIGQITQALQDFVAVTNSFDKFLDLYIDPVLNIFVDIQSVISSTARAIGGIIKLILNNLRDTIVKCLSWAFRKLVGTVLGLPQQTVSLEVMKNILDKIYCAVEKLIPGLIENIEGLLSGLVDKLINVPLCAAEQWTASILDQMMNSIENALSDIISGISWLTGGLGSIYSILNQANSLASQIFSFLDCTGLVCDEPTEWASKFGLRTKSSDNWERIVSKVNIFSGISSDLTTVEGALSQIPMYGNNIAFSECNQRVYNPTAQDDVMPPKVGTRWSVCIPPEIKIIGDGIGAKVVPIVGDDSSIFSIEIINGGSGYTSKNTTVNIIDNSGYGKNARAIAKIGIGGSIQSVYLTNRGSGYCKGNNRYTLENIEIPPTANVGIGISTGGNLNIGIGESTVSSTQQFPSAIQSQFILGCLDEFLIVSPGYGYTSGDSITDGVNTWNLITSPIGGAIVKILPKTTPVCGLSTAPEVYINTNTGVGAEIIPQMRYTPLTNTLVQDGQELTRFSGIAVTSVVDCV